MKERDLLTYPIWERYVILSNVISNLTIKDRRFLFQIIRKQSVHPDMFFPHYGFTLSEFSVWHILCNSRQK